jgi:hypothetical protein
MALGAVTATWLLDNPPTRPKALYLGGLSLLREGGPPGDRIGVDLASVVVTEAAPGQVSSMAFVIDDPRGAVAIGPGQWIAFVDQARDVPIFVGWVDTYKVSAAGIGRSIAVDAIGIEAILDWLVVPSMTITGADLADAYALIAEAIASATPIGWKPRSSGPDPSGISTLALPTNISTPSAIAGTDATIENATLREAIRIILESCVGYLVATFGGEPGDHVATVDVYGGLRIWDRAGIWTWPLPGEYVDTIAIDTAGPNRPADLEHSVAAGDAVRVVSIAGANAAGSGIEGDGSGILGPAAGIDDPSSGTVAKRHTIAARYFASHGAGARGTVRLEESQSIGSPALQPRAGATDVVITDPIIGLAAFRAPIAQIEKIWHASGTEDWTITYGSQLPSGAQLLRQLTRGTIG